MNLIVETDIGRDPDDFLAICYLISAGVDIRCILVTPGDPDQIAITRLLLDEAGVDIPVGAAQPDRDKRSSGGVHYKLLEKYGRQKTAKHDGPGWEVARDALRNYPDSELFVIGPVTSLGRVLREDGLSVSRATMQGGFLGYNQHHHFGCRKLEKFEGRDWVGTFNLNGDRKAAMSFLEADIQDRRFVSKNVCHTVVYNKAIHEAYRPISKDRASELFGEAMDIYLANHGEKKLHDPTAAVCHLHPEIAEWVRGRIVKKDQGWGTDLDPEGDHIIANIAYYRLWRYIRDMN